MYDNMDGFLSKAADADLVKIASTGDGPCTASDALGELYRRYAEGLYAHCVKVHGASLPGGKSEIKAFAGRVFLRFQKYAHNFDPAVARTADGIPKLIRCWLAKQAKWALGEYLAENENKESAHADIDALHLSQQRDDHRRSPKYLANLRKLRTVMRDWPEKDRDIIMSSMPHQDVETGSFNVPLEEMERLKTKWGFNSSNSLGKYRDRRLDELRQLLTSAVA